MKTRITLTPDQEKATSFDRNLVVRAGAGSGKTEVIARRVVRILSQNPDLDLGGLLVLTFTRKAAAQMAERVYQAVEDRLAKAGGRDRTRWESLRDSFAGHYIDTFHGFCARILRRYPVEAGVDPDFGVIEGFELGRLVRDTVTGFLDQASRQFDIRLVPLLAWWKRTDLIGIFCDLLYRRGDLEDWLALYGPGGLTDEQLDSYLVENFCTVGPQQATESAVSLHEDLANIGGKLDCLGEHAESAPAAFRETVGQILELLELAVKDDNQVLSSLAGAYDLASSLKVGGTKAQWESQGLDKEELRSLWDGFVGKFDSLFPAFARESVPRESDRRGHGILRQLAALFLELGALLDNLKSRQGVLDFTDLELKAHRLILEHPQITAQLRKQFRYVMVDEFQDTNRFQWEIVSRLCRNNGGELEPDKLCLVGDEKQSIYAFRGGDVTVFGAAGKELVGPGADQGGGEEVVFRENFRSHEGLIGFFNRFFELLFVRRDGGYSAFEARPQRMTGPVSGRGQVSEPVEVPVELLLVTGKDDPDQAENGPEDRTGSREIDFEEIFREGELIARRIKQLQAQGVRGPVALLLRTRSLLKAYETSLQRQGIEYTVTRGKGFYQRQEVMDTVNLLAFLWNRSDDLALVGALRSPFFAFPDEAVFCLSRLRRGGTLWEALSRTAGGENGPSDELSRSAAPYAALFARARRLLETLLDIAGKTDLGLLIETALDQGAYFAAQGSAAACRRVRANLEKLVETARAFSAVGQSGLGEFVRFVREQMDRDLDEGEADPPALGPDSVVIMTVHQSKGLEFPVVVVPHLHQKFSLVPRGGFLIGPAETRTAQRKTFVGLRLPGGSPEDGIFHRLIRSHCQERELAELKRLLYVACTRAMDRLILCGQADLDQYRREPGQAYNEEQRDQAKSWMDWTAGFLRLGELGPGDCSVALNSGDESEEISLSVTRYRAEKQLQEQYLAVKEQVLPDPALWRKSLLPLSVPPRIRLSPTAYLDFHACPRLYYLKHVLGLTEDLLKPGRTAKGKAAPGSSGGTGPESEKRGKARGLAVHWLMARRLADPDHEDLIRKRLTGELRKAGVELSAVPIQADLDYIRQYLKNWRDSAPAKAFLPGGPVSRDYREISFSLEIGNVRLNGTIDRLYRVQDTWRVLDYKTDHLNDQAAPDIRQAQGVAQAHHYDIQLRLYCLAASRLLGCPVQEAALFFMYNGVGLPYTFNNSDLDELEARLSRFPTADHPGFYRVEPLEKCDLCPYGEFCPKSAPRG